MNDNLSNVEISVQELKLLVNTLTKSVALSLRKRYTWLGGTRTPMIIHWPNGMEARGEVRNQVIHVDFDAARDAVIDRVIVLQGLPYEPPG